MCRFPILALVIPLLCGNAAPADVEVRLDRLRNQKGVLHLCLTRDPAHFPNCGNDPRAVKRSAASTKGTIRFSGLQPGSYAVSVIHDENGNGKLDTLVGIPREGFGFSRNPVVRFGPPRFDQVRVEVPSGFSRQTLRMQYLL